MWFHVRITEECNLKCTYCYAKNYDRTSAMPFDLFQEIIVKIKSLPKSDDACDALAIGITCAVCLANSRLANKL